MFISYNLSKSLVESSNVAMCFCDSNKCTSFMDGNPHPELFFKILNKLYEGYNLIGKNY